MKRIRLSKHAEEQAEERGATLAEVKEAIRKGSREPATRGREMCRYNFGFNRKWQGRHYAIKQVAPVVKEEANRNRCHYRLYILLLRQAGHENQLRSRD